LATNRIKTNIPNNETKEVCAKCGGKCCKAMPGRCLPEDIRREFPSQNTIESVKKALSSKKYQIDRWEGDNPKYYVRPRTKGNTEIFNFSWGGECIFLTKTGCRLSFNRRPFQCRDLVPRGSFYCGGQKGTDRLFFGKKWHAVRGFAKLIKELRESYDKTC